MFLEVSTENRVAVWLRGVENPWETLKARNAIKRILRATTCYEALDVPENATLEDVEAAHHRLFFTRPDVTVAPGAAEARDILVFCRRAFGTRTWTKTFDGGLRRHVKPDPHAPRCSKIVDVFAEKHRIGLLGLLRPGKLDCRLVSKDVKSVSELNLDEFEAMTGGQPCKRPTATAYLKSRSSIRETLEEAWRNAGSAPSQFRQFKVPFADYDLKGARHIDTRFWSRGNTRVLVADVRMESTDDAIRYGEVRSLEVALEAWSISGDEREFVGRLGVDKTCDALTTVMVEAEEVAAAIESRSEFTKVIDRAQIDWSRFGVIEL